MARQTIDVALALETIAIVRPGDTLIVAIDRPFSHDRAAEFRAQMADKLPGVEIVIVEARQLAVYRPAEGG